MSDQLQLINNLKDRYGLSWCHEYDLTSVGGIMWSCGSTQIALTGQDPEHIYECLLEAIRHHDLKELPYRKPLKKNFMLATVEGELPELAELEYDCIIPDDPTHPGSFAHHRTNHIHEGIDLYAQENDVVYAMVSGTVTNIIEDFTGPDAGSPWWNKTSAAVVEDSDGVWIYGEIKPRSVLMIGSSVTAGDALGHVVPVLTKSKGYPQSMLHLERYGKGTTDSVGIWNLGDLQPTNMQDPTPLLISGLIRR